MEKVERVAIEVFEREGDEDRRRVKQMKNEEEERSHGSKSLTTAPTRAPQAARGVRCLDTPKFSFSTLFFSFF